ncbi:hypothetical protein U2S04_003036 [Escherichia coli]|uniref:hypothetical protein n=1 Tax=Escherichia coli TaxID=562 RepID=UPI002AB5DBB4|nr:hypothetical protein [Escherichia coli]EMA3285150.1 hypothetical protein [Escherichia coli]
MAKAGSTRYLDAPPIPRTKEQVLKEARDQIDHGLFLCGTAAERMAKRFSDLYAKQIWFDNWQASIYPLQRKPDMHWPEYVDPRMRKYRGRMGQVIND